MLRKTPSPAEQRASLVVSQTIDLATIPASEGRHA
jgi:hypothetical protein